MYLHSGHVFLRKIIFSVYVEKTGLADHTVPDDCYLQSLRRPHGACRDIRQIITHNSHFHQQALVLTLFHCHRCISTIDDDCPPRKTNRCLTNVIIQSCNNLIKLVETFAMARPFKLHIEARAPFRGRVRNDSAAGRQRRWRTRVTAGSLGQFVINSVDVSCPSCDNKRATS